jgi:hypothetical protein
MNDPIRNHSLLKTSYEKENLTRDDRVFEFGSCNSTGASECWRAHGSTYPAGSG